MQQFRIPPLVPIPICALPLKVNNFLLLQARPDLKNRASGGGQHRVQPLCCTLNC